MKEIRSISFDTSFLLKDDPAVDKTIKMLKKDKIPSFITTTVVDELEKLKIYGRIEPEVYNKATARWKRVYSKVIDFRNRFLSKAVTNQCVVSMQEHHGVDPKNIVNDCNILMTGLKHGIDLFLSEDFHFTSKITDEVLKDVKHTACTEYRQMCAEDLYSIDTITFLKAYESGAIDMEIIKSMKKSIKKPGKRLGGGKTTKKVN
jgi:rRNA-processing protein FCF1